MKEILPYEADDSPFPEVRAVVPAVDDPSLPVNTVRMWFIGIIFTIVSPRGTEGTAREMAMMLTGAITRLAAVSTSSSIFATPASQSVHW